MRYAISACLMGVNCKYNGGNNEVKAFKEYMQNQDYILICPEVMGGLPIPRASCEIVDDKIINTQGEDCSKAFYTGAKEALQKIHDEGIGMVILQPRSPSCGIGKIYDGTFQGRLKEGNGIFATLLLQEGIKAVSVEEFVTTYMKKE